MQTHKEKVEELAYELIAELPSWCCAEENEQLFEAAKKMAESMLVNEEEAGQ
jgi:CRISPR/Cas system-associated protein Csm6